MGRNVHGSEEKEDGKIKENFREKNKNVQFKGKFYKVKKHNHANVHCL